MRNFKKIIVALFTMTMLMCSVASAATASDITKALEDAGLGTYAANVSTYLQTHEITEAQGDAIVTEIKNAQALLNGRAFSELTLDEKTTLKGYAEKAANIVGLTIQVNAGTITVVDAKGNVIQTITTKELAAVVNVLKFENLSKVVDVVVEYHKSGDKDFKPSGGQMKPTATNYGNTMVLGAGLIALAGLTFMLVKKKLSA